MGPIGSSSSEVPAIVGLVGGSLSGASAIEESMEYSSPDSEASAMVKSDSVAMLMDGEWVTGVTGDSGTAFGSGVVIGSSGEG